AALLYGSLAGSDPSGYPKARIALIQPNSDPWTGGPEEFRRDFDVLRRLSDRALAEGPGLVVWPETAFVPRIHWHLTYREAEGRELWLLVSDFLEYMATQDVPFVVGNHDARRDFAGNRRDYNAAILFEGGEMTEVYRKMHLVPFTEHFPFADLFPGIHRALLNADTHFWDPGTERTVFAGPGFAFSTPICFEDSFGYISGDFVRSGAEVLVNLSNDAWAGSLSSQNQHLAMAVFRAVENRRSMVRSTASGQTAAIDPNGRILAMARPFSEEYLVVEVPIVRDRITVYNRFGDFLGRGFALIAAGILITGGTLCILKRAERNRPSVSDGTSKTGAGPAGPAKKAQNGRP
ncbi:MAG: apolipoprotein N-acyltransferase, partial [Treponema sp.]|nr:apolipoprotein N-acyltransferase [Treponema sp.]